MINIKILYTVNLFCFKILANNINNEEPISVSSSKITCSSKQQKASGRPFNPVWNHFNQIEKKGHYPAKAQLFYFKEITKDDKNQNNKK
ncbi:32728_t:CDS:2 [Gigaspora margarita]|uniref:32728_t:CDS:1 n=1 Tax=Gigaspora margarita TaxID=4874 RepID=A0ABN7UAB6_GIGMA|nr:32728_t:CDS:2 [Gigaspora margarita]